MENYYSSNALYEQIENRSCSNFLWSVGNSWSLLYGDSSRIPKLVVFVSGTSSAKLGASGQDRLARMCSLTQELAERAGLPFGEIEFDDSVEQVSEVFLNGEIVDIDALKAWFSGFGLPVQSGTVALKAINDAASSAYHKWQRAALGRITVTDLDLVRIDAETGEPIAIYELKRSYIPLDRWSPFSDDYPNFNMLFDFAEMAGVKCNIVYNVRHKHPKFFDDVSKICIFSYSKNVGAERVASLSLNEFLESDWRS